jgi:ankyrin repeat protein
LFSILEQKKTLKVILTTQPEDSTAVYLEQIARTALGEGFITTDEHLTWSELTSRSQMEILKKTVIFQGKRVALNQITSAESMPDSFQLADLLQEKEIKIGEEPVLSAYSGYNEKYYIDRTFKHSIFIKQDISSDRSAGEYYDLLASTEQEFKQLCQQNPKRNVHWLQKEKSGEFIWQQSQGNLKILRKHIDIHKSHSFTPSDLVKLMQQAKHHKIMVIADREGMGKSTVLTHLSEQIKQNFPAHWLVRIDLNDYTEQLKALKGKKMHKARVLDFVLNQVLKLESLLEKELFKKSLEGNEISKVVVMVDGFDEISPTYKETVINMLQVLKQTSLEQLLVTTRPHLTEELEDNLQQISYTLQPFSEVAQVEFLKKFWLLNSDLEHKDEQRLLTYATALISKLAQSISDKDREFTGIPLQTRMLAEAFKEDFESFYVTEKSKPELPQKLKLLELYRRFIDRKYDIFFTDKSKFELSNISAERIRKQYLKNIQLEHQLLSLEALFTEDEVTFLQNYDRTTFTDDELAMIGIAQRNSEGKPHFIHRTFAEYFVADFLIKQLTNKTKQNKQVKELLLSEVLLRKDCHVIRAFMDGLLENSKPLTEVLKEYGDILVEQLTKRKVQGPSIVDKTALQKAAEENNTCIIGFILDSLKSGEHSNTLKEMLLDKVHDGKTAWHVAVAAGHIKVVDDLWIWAKAQLKPHELGNEFLLGKDSNFITAWHLAAKKKNLQMLVKLWDWATEVQLKPKELKIQVFLNKDIFNKTPWYIALEGGKVEVLEKMWQWAKELQLNPEELRNEVLLSKGYFSYTHWHMSAKRGYVEVLEKLWEWAKELQLKPKELRNEVLLSKEKFKSTAWQKAANSGHVEVLVKLWDWAKNCS